MRAFPDKGAILVVNLVWIPGGNDEALLTEIGDEDTLAAQNQAVVFKRESGEVKLGVEAQFKPVGGIIEMADHQFVPLMDHEVGLLHVEDMGVPAHQDGRAAIQLIAIDIERLIRVGPAFKDNGPVGGVDVVDPGLIDHESFAYRVAPVLAVVADVKLVFSDHAVVVHDDSGQVTNSADGFLALHVNGDGMRVGRNAADPLGVPPGDGIVVDNALGSGIVTRLGFGIACGGRPPLTGEVVPVFTGDL